MRVSIIIIIIEVNASEMLFFSYKIGVLLNIFTLLPERLFT